MMTGVNMVQVSYPGETPALTDLIAGRVQVTFNPLPASIEVHQNGHIARIGRHHHGTIGHPAGGPEPRRLRAGLRGKHVVRSRCTQEYPR